MTKELKNKTILVTRDKSQAGKFLNMIKAEEARGVSFPVIEITEPPTFAEIDNALKEIKSFDYILFTSVNAVERFFKRAKEKDIKTENIADLKAISVGPKTEKAMLKFSLRSTFTAKTYVAEGVLEALKKEDLKNKKILFPRALKAREYIIEELEKMGAKVSMCPVYETINPNLGLDKLKKVLKDEKIDIITFTSASTVENFASSIDGYELKEILKDKVIAAIGPVTRDKAKELGIEVNVMPDVYTLDGMIEALKKYFKN